jgi:hypothetical protein
MAELCRWASAHWIRFRGVETPDSLDLSARPRGAAGWKIGPDMPAGPDGRRRPSPVWCALGLYASRAAAEGAVAEPARFMPFLDRAVEAWHALLLPFAHRGECNHLDPSRPGALFRVAADPGGPLMVMTSAGFDLGPDLDVDRVVDFRRNTDRVREQAAVADGIRAHQVFAPHTRVDDGITMTVWRDDAAMLQFAYGCGRHRVQIERQMAGRVVDRSSFTRFRILRTAGRWQGSDPAAAAPDAGQVGLLAP